MARTGRLLQDEPHRSSHALLGAAVLHLVPRLLFWSIRGLSFSFDDFLYIGGCAFLVAMALLARWWPLVPSVLALIVYVPFALLSFVTIPDFFSRPVFWIPTIGTLILIAIALMAAIRANPGNPPSASQG